MPMLNPKKISIMGIIRLPCHNHSGRQYVPQSVELTMEASSKEKADLLKLLNKKPRSGAELLGKAGSAKRSARQAALAALLGEGKAVKIENKYFVNDPSGSFDRLVDAEAVRLDAYLRSVPELLSSSGKKLKQGVENSVLATVALQRLLETSQAIELKYKKERLCLHSARLPTRATAAGDSQPISPDTGRELSLQEVRQAYDTVRGRQLGSAVFISDLADALQIGVPRLHEWIRSEVIESGYGSLDEGHWPTATEPQRAAAIEHLGSRRLLIRF
jgi:hypothetical protein